MKKKLIESNKTWYSESWLHMVSFVTREFSFEAFTMSVFISVDFAFF